MNRVVVPPSPSWPYSLSPQHHTVPSVSRAHECEPPTAMPVAVDIPGTSTGVFLSVVVVESTPGLPLLLLPQHLIAPPVSRAHE